MDLNVLVQAVNPSLWKVFIPLYFYFTGLSAGSFILSSLSTVFGIKKFKPLAFPSAVAALVLLVIAPVMLIADLGQPLRFLNVLNPAYFNPTSPISYGSWLLTFYPIATSIYIWLMIKGGASFSGKYAAQAAAQVAATSEGDMASPADKKLKIMGMITIPLAVSVHAYTGFVFGVVKAKALWNTALMPGYFLTSAILSGVGLLVIVYLVLSKRRQAIPDPGLLQSLANMMIGIIVLDLFWVISLWLVMGMGTEAARIAVRLELHDPLYLLGEIGAGMLLPLLILVPKRLKTKPGWLAVASVLVLFGVFIMRYSLVFTGVEASNLVSFF
ncbi:MAG: NrfD/PsrC family molybdoenzyme membrane anchor subunit [Desulfitobacteriaceae bacterium]